MYLCHADDTVDFPVAWPFLENTVCQTSLPSAKVETPSTGLLPQVARSGSDGAEGRQRLDRDDRPHRLQGRDPRVARGELPGILVPEAQGGLGLGAVDAGVVMEEIGRHLSVTPFFAS